MEYKYKIQEKIIPVEVELKAEHRLIAHIGKSNYEVEYTRVSENQIHLSINGKNSNVFLAAVQDGKMVFINGNTYTVREEDESIRNKTGKGRGDKTPDVVTPPMPALVVSVLVENGDRVKKGESVMILSAMKMETTLTAPYDGKVKAIHASKGDKVNPGDILIDIERNC